MALVVDVLVPGPGNRKGNTMTRPRNHVLLSNSCVVARDEVPVMWRHDKTGDLLVVHAAAVLGKPNQRRHPEVHGVKAVLDPLGVLATSILARGGQLAACASVMAGDKRRAEFETHMLRDGNDANLINPRAHARDKNINGPVLGIPLPFSEEKN